MGSVRVVGWSLVVGDLGRLCEFDICDGVVHECLFEIHDVFGMSDWRAWRWKTKKAIP